MFGPFDEIFDLNSNGRLDPSEQTLEIMSIDELMRDDDEDEDDDDDDNDDDDDDDDDDDE